MQGHPCFDVGGVDVRASDPAASRSGEAREAPLRTGDERAAGSASGVVVSVACDRVPEAGVRRVTQRGAGDDGLLPIVGDAAQAVDELGDVAESGGRGRVAPRALEVDPDGRAAVGGNQGVAEVEVAVGESRLVEGSHGAAQLREEFGALVRLTAVERLVRRQCVEPGQDQQAVAIRQPRETQRRDDGRVRGGRGPERLRLAVRRAPSDRRLESLPERVSSGTDSEPLHQQRARRCPRCGRRVAADCRAGSARLRPRTSLRPRRVPTVLRTARRFHSLEQGRSCRPAGRSAASAGDRGVELLEGRDVVLPRGRFRARPGGPADHGAPALIGQFIERTREAGRVVG